MSFEKKHCYTLCVGLSVYMRSSQYTYFVIKTKVDFTINVIPKFFYGCSATLPLRLHY
jgi:hypothetical protein